MNKYYTRKQAIELLGFKSTNAFLQVVRKHPEAFVNVNPRQDRENHPWYDKAALDKFYQMREQSKQEKP